MSKLDLYGTKRKRPIISQDKKMDKNDNKIPFDVTRAQRFMDDPCARPC